MTITTIGANTGDDFSGAESTYLYSGAPTTNYNGSSILQMYDGVVGTSDRINAISFSGLSNIAPTEIVSAASMWLYKTDTDAGTQIKGVFHRSLRNWVDSQATYNNYSTGNAWTAAGGLSDGNDRSATVSLEVTIDGTSGWYSNSSAQFATDTQDFIDGSLSNYGWLVEYIDIIGAQFGTAASENNIDGTRPYTSVTHAPAVSEIIPFRRRIEGY